MDQSAYCKYLTQKKYLLNILIKSERIILRRNELVTWLDTKADSVIGRRDEKARRIDL